MKRRKVNRIKVREGKTMLVHKDYYNLCEQMRQRIKKEFVNLPDNQTVITKIMADNYKIPRKIKVNFMPKGLKIVKRNKK